MPANPDVTRFLHQGRLRAMPRRQEHRRAVARWLAHSALPDLLEPVGERELTRRLAAIADDPVGVRRALVDLGLVHRTRDGAEYWRTELTEHDELSGAGTGRTVHLDGEKVGSVAELCRELARALAAAGAVPAPARRARDRDRSEPTFRPEPRVRQPGADDERLGPDAAALDALDALLAAADAARGAGGVRVVWHGFAGSRDALGFAATRRHYVERIGTTDGPSADRLRDRLADLEAGRGPTLAELVLEQFARHPGVELVLR